MTNHEKFVEIINTPQFRLNQAAHPDSQLDEALKLASQSQDHSAAVIAVATLLLGIMGPDALAKFAERVVVQGMALQKIVLPATREVA